eukprot:COSAG02_NODE_32418_length_516_cov_1.431655_1_plen_98_part_10
MNCSTRPVAAGTDDGDAANAELPGTETSSALVPLITTTSVQAMVFLWSRQWGFGRRHWCFCGRGNGGFGDCLTRGRRSVIDSIRSVRDSGCRFSVCEG